MGIFARHNGEWYRVDEGGSGGSSEFLAEGGNIHSVGIYKYHVFTSDGDFVVKSGQSHVQILCIGGGGGGVSNSGGGGGGGAISTFSDNVQTLSVGTYSVVVGEGGAPQSKQADASIFNGASIVTALGGGGGSGQEGGSGGGGSQNVSGGAANGPNTFRGGTGVLDAGAGGGGATAVGANGTTSGRRGGAGGQGMSLSVLDENFSEISDFSGMSRLSSGGGGGSVYDGGGSGGAGGAGAGNGGTNTAAGGNASSYGSGGGGGGRHGPTGNNGPGGSGKSGLVVVRYFLDEKVEAVKDTIIISGRETKINRNRKR